MKIREKPITIAAEVLATQHKFDIRLFADGLQFFQVDIFGLETIEFKIRTKKFQVVERDGITYWLNNIIATRRQNSSFITLAIKVEKLEDAVILDSYDIIGRISEAHFDKLNRFIDSEMRITSNEDFFNKHFFGAQLSISSSQSQKLIRFLNDSKVSNYQIELALERDFS